MPDSAMAPKGRWAVLSTGERPDHLEGLSRAQRPIERDRASFDQHAGRLREETDGMDRMADEGAVW